MAREIERLASDIAIRLGDDLLRRAGLESAPNRLWAATRQKEEAAWLQGRDDTVAFIGEELEGCVRAALEAEMDADHLADKAAELERWADRLEKCCSRCAIPGRQIRERAAEIRRGND